MSSNRDPMDCPYCGFDEAMTGNEGSQYDTSYCSICGWNDPTPGDSIIGWALDRTKEDFPDLDEDSEKFQNEHNRISMEMVEEEAGRPNIPTDKQILNAKRSIKILEIVVLNNNDGIESVEEYVNWHDIYDQCISDDVYDLYFIIFEANFDE